MLQKLFASHKSALKYMFAGATVSVMGNETTDNRAKSLVNVLFINAVANDVQGIHPVLVKVKLVNEVNVAVIGRIFIKTLTIYGAEFDDVRSFVSDSAAYMKNAFREHIAPQCENALHICNLRGASH